MTMTRIPRRHLPDGFVKCGVPHDCPYMSSNGYCDDPRTAKGNSDAACHRMGNKELLEYLPSPISPAERGTP